MVRRRYQIVAMGLCRKHGLLVAQRASVSHPPERAATNVQDGTYALKKVIACGGWGPNAAWSHRAARRERVRAFPVQARLTFLVGRQTATDPLSGTAKRRPSLLASRSERLTCRQRAETGQTIIRTPEDVHTACFWKPASDSLGISSNGRFAPEAASRNSTMTMSALTCRWPISSISRTDGR